MLPPLKEYSLFSKLMVTPYQKHNSCQDAIFATREAILKVVCECGDAFISLFDLEKAYESLEHSVFLDSLSDTGSYYRQSMKNYLLHFLNSVVKSGWLLSTPFPVSCGAQQGSFLSPIFFLMVTDRLLTRRTRPASQPATWRSCSCERCCHFQLSNQRPRQNDCQFCHKKWLLPQRVQE